MINEYELYTDESYHSRRYLMLGGTICTDKRRERLRDCLMQVRKDFGLSREMRWTKVSNSYLDAYKAWVDVFLKDRFVRFSLLKIDTWDCSWREFCPQPSRRPSQDDRLASAFYQFLLVSFGSLHETKRWRLYPDQGFFSRDKVLDRVDFLFNRTYKMAFGQNTSRIIRLMRARDSKLEDLIQLTDVLLGALSCIILNEFPSSKAKCELADHCAKAIEKSPKTQTRLDKVVVTPWVHPERFSYP